MLGADRRGMAESGCPDLGRIRSAGSLRPRTDSRHDHGRRFPARRQPTVAVREDTIAGIPCVEARRAQEKTPIPSTESPSLRGYSPLWHCRLNRRPLNTGRPCSADKPQGSAPLLGSTCGGETSNASLKRRVHAPIYGRIRSLRRSVTLGARPPMHTVTSAAPLRRRSVRSPEVG